MSIKMKTWIAISIVVALIIAAFLLGRHDERTRNMQTEVGDLNKRIASLEEANSNAESRWRWISLASPLFVWAIKAFGKLKHLKPV